MPRWNQSEVSPLCQTGPKVLGSGVGRVGVRRSELLELSRGGALLRVLLLSVRVRVRARVRARASVGLGLGTAFSRLEMLW